MKYKIKSTIISNSSIENNNNVLKLCRLMGITIFGIIAGISGIHGLSGKLFQ